MVFTPMNLVGAPGGTRVVWRGLGSGFWVERIQTRKCGEHVRSTTRLGSRADGAEVVAGAPARIVRFGTVIRLSPERGHALDQH